jgi:hypothetical protein
MKKAVSPFLVAIALIATFGVISPVATGYAQAPATGQIQMDPPEYAMYDDAVNKQTTPQTQAPAIEAYLAKYPSSKVKNEMLLRLMIDYSSFDLAKTIIAADNVLAADPTNFQAIYTEVQAHSAAAQATKDAATKQKEEDAAASFATKGLALPKPDAVKADVYSGQVIPFFYDAIVTDDLLKNDFPGIITAVKAELAAVPLAITSVPGLVLQHTFYLGYADSKLPTPDYVPCTFYATRAAAFAPEPYHTQFLQVATYCYKRYHGGTDGYDAVTASAKANLNPPDDLKITPAPTDAEIVTTTIASTPDLSILAIDDKEYIIRYGTTEQADKVFSTVKDKAQQFKDALIIAATADQLQLAISADAVATNTADFTFDMKTPFKTVPDVKSKITITGVWTSYTQKPLMITMTDAEEYVKPAPKAPVHHPVARKKP